MVPEAAEMASAIEAACNALLEHNLIQSQSYGSIGQAVGQVKANGVGSKAWSYEISASSPITFSEVVNTDLNQIITPRLYITVNVDDALSAKNVPPFGNLNCVLEVLGEDGKTLLSTHVDLAEKHANGQYQDAPLFHLQIGGHRPGADRTLELRLKEPRLMHPPMDLLLAAEIIVANFFPDEWKALRQDPLWITAICQSQKLCYSIYSAKLASCLTIDSGTAVEHLWAPAWGA